MEKGELNRTTQVLLTAAGFGVIGAGVGLFIGSFSTKSNAAAFADRRSVIADHFGLASPTRIAVGYSVTLSALR
jgi:hypothetical protein